MNLSFQKSIDAVLNTDKVEGLLIFDLNGKVYFRHFPDDVTYEQAGKLPEYILELYNLVSYNYYHCSDLVLKYEQRTLFFRRSHGKAGKDFVLAVLGAAGINFQSMKLATNLAMKLIELQGSEEIEEKKGFFRRLTS